MSSALDPVRHLVALSYLLGTLYFGTVPRRAPLGIQSDKLLHAFVFFGMVLVTFPAISALMRRWPERRARAQAYALGYAVLVGGLLELIQTMLPSRHGDVRDLLANLLGAGSAYLLLWGALSWQRRLSS